MRKLICSSIALLGLIASQAVQVHGAATATAHASVAAFDPPQPDPNHPDPPFSVAFDPPQPDPNHPDPPVQL